MTRLPAPLWALACLYVINAGMTAGLTLRYAEITSRLDVSTALFGALLVGEVVSLWTVILTIAPRLVALHGPWVTARWSAVAYCTTTALAGLVPSPVWFVAALIARGGVNAVLDLAVTSATSVAEDSYRRTLFTWMDIPAALGLLLAATAGALAAGRLAVPVYGALLGAAGLFLLWVVWRHIPTNLAAQVAVPAHVRHVPTGALALLSAIGLWLLVAGQDWPTLVLSELGARPGMYGVGSVAFVVGVVFSLLISGPLADRHGRPPVLLVAGCLVVVGMGAVMLLHSSVTVTIALAVAGLGAGPIHALALSAAGAGSPNTLARVVSCGYIGAALSKPAISGLSTLTGLQVALAATSLGLGALACALARATRATDA